ncbi:5-oxoprolinase subunit PxpA [Ferrimonas balearica]|uniref:5-oxoprolinase subunit PxpA n=1 Tax=Ferrimonas balearica TaxID=44012 RepID=UPI001C99B768|nr:5-oxoprolinase subunit PxpA [Ferrimonas balearica]MBY5990879.1 LamB/YcsF family protein [Ferrimonas balearica]
MHWDLNCDLGELSGEANQDAALMPFISSANIACGLHAGGPELMARTVALALAHGVAIGAHPGYDDRAHFGRRPQTLSAAQVRELILYQLGALEAIVRVQGGRLHHVKPHGALYNQAADDAELALAIATAVRDFDPSLVLVGLSGSALPQAGHDLGLAVAHEVFADRRYLANGRLVPRTESDALIETDDEALAQIQALAQEGRVTAREGHRVLLRADTLCLHGDGPHALAFAQKAHQFLTEQGIPLTPPNTDKDPHE